MRRQISSSRPAALVAAGRGRRRRSPRPPIEALERRVLLSAYIVTNLNDAGSGSLRDTIQQTNLRAGADTITFAPGLRGTITLTTGELQITDDLSIIGPGPQYLTISGNNASGVFAFENSPSPSKLSVAIEGLTITGGANGSTLVNFGASAALADCDFIANAPSGSDSAVVFSFDMPMTMTHCTFSANSGIALSSEVSNVTVADCTFAGNTGIALSLNSGVATISDTAVSGNGGGIYENPTGGPATITNCTISGNKEDGIYAGSSTMTIADCTVAGNLGTGVANDGEDLTLLDSTVSGNGAAKGGSGVTNYQGGLKIINSTICNNSGGGIASYEGSLDVTNSTITGNTAQSEAGVLFSLVNPIGGGPKLDNTIVAANHDAKGVASDIGIANGQAITFQGSNNLIGPGGSGGLVNEKNANIVGVADANLHLGALGNYGGRTQTIAPLAGSPAIDHGSNSLAIGADGKPLLTDQRGFGRVFNGIVDIGAFEYGSSIPGDANGEGKVNFQDLVLLTRNYGHSGTWSNGDFNGDGKVAFDDLIILARNYGTALPPVTLPAPSAVRADASSLIVDLTTKPRRREAKTRLVTHL